MSISISLLDKSGREDDILLQKLRSQYPTMPSLLESQLLAVERENDFKLAKDEKIVRLSEYVLRRYYRQRIFIRVIFKIYILRLIIDLERLFQELYITGCQTVDGQGLSLSDCITCNRESTTYDGNFLFRFVNFWVATIGIVCLMIILKQGLSRANLCLRVLQYRIFVRTSWYYWRITMLIIAVVLLCAFLSLVSSILVAKQNAISALIPCQVGPLEGQRVQLVLSDYSGSGWYLAALFISSIVSYWPVIGFLVELHNKPYRVFMEPEDMFKLNGEMIGDGRLFSNLSFIQNKVRLVYLLEEISLVYKELKKRKPFSIDRVPDELLRVALLRLFNKGKVKTYKKRI